MSQLSQATIVCTIDNNYVEHCAVMLKSLFTHNRDMRFSLVIISNGLAEAKRLVLDKFVRQFASAIVFKEIDEQLFAGAPLSHHVSLATYFRLLLPTLVDCEIDKVLFLDSDIVIRQSISSLWDLDIEQYSHAAVENPGVSSAHKRNLGMDENSCYFNAGVMLINLRAWREYDVTKKAMEFIQNHPDKITFWDQDALNYVLQNRWLRIESKWNAQHNLFAPNSAEAILLPSEDYKLARYNPAIVHFSGAGPCKPWHYRCVHPFKDEYLKYRRETPWRRVRLTGKPNLKRRVLQASCYYRAVLFGLLRGRRNKLGMKSKGAMKYPS